MAPRDAMNTEKNKDRFRLIFSLNGDCLIAMPPWFASVLQLCKILARREGFAIALATSRPPENGRRRLALCPGGTPQEISRGQARASGRGPRLSRRTGHAPAGHRRSFFGGRLAASAPPLVASGKSGRQRLSRIPGLFFDAPLGHGAIRHGFRGRRPLARTCPRLISSGVPPGRETGGRALTKGNPRREHGVPTHSDVAPPRCVPRISVVLMAFSTA